MSVDHFPDEEAFIDRDTPLPLEAARLLSDTLSLAELRGHED